MVKGEKKLIVECAPVSGRVNLHANSNITGRKTIGVQFTLDLLRYNLYISMLRWFFDYLLKIDIQRTYLTLLSNKSIALESYLGEFFGIL